MNHAPTLEPDLVFYRCQHDAFTELELENQAGRKQIRVSKTDMTDSAQAELHPYLFDNHEAIKNEAPKVWKDMRRT